MTAAILRPKAEQDLIDKTLYYRREGDDALGERFFDAAVDALRAIEQMPLTGSPRLGELCGVAGLRSHRIEGFPCGWFYFPADEQVDVVRLLAYAQDISSIVTDLR